MKKEQFNKLIKIYSDLKELLMDSRTMAIPFDPIMKDFGKLLSELRAEEMEGD